MRFLNQCLFALAFTTSIACSAAPAQDEAPDVLVKNVSNEVLTLVRQDKDLQSGGTRKFAELVETKVLPHFNFNRMTALAVGRDWRAATPDQQKALINEFRTLLVRTYSNAFTAYKDQSIDFKPLRMGAGDTDVVVRTEVKQPGAKPVAIDYSLEKGPNGWKVYDVVVGGISLVTTYRESFSTEVRASGIDGLIKSLQAKNQAPAQKSAK
jgi:phospholipid transport system substrate-binding protein